MISPLFVRTIDEHFFNTFFIVFQSISNLLKVKIIAMQWVCVKLVSVLV